MSRIRSLSRTRLAVVVAALVGLSVTGAVASAALGGAETPPPRPLAEAIHRAATAPPPAGVSARIEFANRLLPAGACPRERRHPCSPGPRVVSGPATTGVSASSFSRVAATRRWPPTVAV